MNAVLAEQKRADNMKNSETKMMKKGGAVWTEAGIRPELWKGKREDENKGWPVD